MGDQSNAIRETANGKNRSKVWQSDGGAFISAHLCRERVQTNRKPQIIVTADVRLRVLYSFKLVCNFQKAYNLHVQALPDPGSSPPNECKILA